MLPRAHSRTSLEAALAREPSFRIEDISLEPIWDRTQPFTGTLDDALVRGQRRAELTAAIEGNIRAVAQRRRAEERRLRRSLAMTRSRR